jgi:hypothetical protein
MKQIFTFIFVILFTNNFAVPLNGTKTIGGNAPDYTTINAAISALNTQGIDGAITFKIRDGIYNEVLVFRPTVGASAINTITFEGESQDSAAVIINGATTANRQNSVRLDTVSFFTLKHVTIRQNANVNNNAIVFINKGKYCTISNCELRGHNSSTSSATDYAIQGCNDSNLVIRSCLIQGASEGLVISNPTFSHRNVLIENCKIFTSGDNINMIQGAFAVIRNNYIVGRVLLQQTSRCEVSGNLIFNMLQSISSNGWSNYKMRIFNNVIRGGSYQGTVSYGFWAATSSNFDFINNTIYMDSPINGYCIYVDPSSGGIRIMNNIIYRKDTSSINYIMRYPTVEATPGYIISDYNTFYRSLGQFSNSYNSLQAFTTATGLDSNSTVMQPIFASDTLLIPSVANHLLAPSSNTNILTDIVGNIRNTTVVTKGAYEMNSLPVLNISSDTTTLWVCMANPINLNTQFAGTLPITYSWYKDGTLLPNETQINFSIQNAQVSSFGNYKCIASNNFGVDTSYFVVSEITTTTLPVVTSLGNTTICEGQWVTLQSNVSGIWSTGSVGDSLTVNYGGSFYILSENECGLVTQSNIVTVVEIPNVTQLTITVDGNVLTAGVAEYYQWQLNGIDIPNATLQSYTANVNGVYTVVVGNSNTCTSISQSVLLNSVGLNEKTANNNSYKVFYNEGELYLNNRLSVQDSKFYIKVFDILGKQLFYSNKDLKVYSNINIPAGIYFVEINNQVEKLYVR